MSSGNLTVTGTQAHYQLRMPMYEVAHVSAPERTLLDHVRFAGARMVSSNCAPDATQANYICEADYQFAAAPAQIEIECTLASVTVPNHVHLLHAQMGEKRDQAVFDISFTRATLRFRPPTATEVAVSEASAGWMRAWGGVVQLLFLAALVLAARTRRELIEVTATFIAGQALCLTAVPRLNWEPAPRFVEAAAALTVAYLAVEILMLPKAGARWAIAGVLGIFHGLYFHLFILDTGYSAIWVLTGAALAEVAATSVFALLYSRIARLSSTLRMVRIPAVGLLLFGLIWFGLRLRS